MNKSPSCVITTIQEPTEAIIQFTAYLYRRASKLVVIGDKKGPATYPIEGVVFLSLQDQLKSQFELARKLPTAHYARKNIGYLTAIAQGASCIYETDDDNAPLPNWTMREETVTAKEIEGRRTEVRGQMSEDREQETVGGEQRAEGRGQRAEVGSRESENIQVKNRWVNVYKYFTDENIWPRGFPIDEIHSEVPEVRGPQYDLPDLRGKQRSEVRDRISEGKGHNSEFRLQNSDPGIRAPIQQGLVNNSPDVDAIWRMVLDRPLDFQQGPSVYLPPQCWCPFNSQSTWWWPVAYPLLYLPSYCSFRMTDIWRSFIAQRCLWELGYGVVFHSPEVVQERNEHNLIRDFKDEIPGYTRNKEFVEILERLSLGKGPDAISRNLKKCYEALVTEEFFPEREIELVETWLEDLRKMLEIR